MSKTPLGEMLVEARAITREQLDDGLHIERTIHESVKIGQIVVIKGYCTPEAVEAALEKQN